MLPPTLDEAGVRLRAPGDADLDFLVAFANDPDLRGWLRFWQPATRADELAWLRSLEGNDDLVWLIEAQGAPVGCIGLHEWDRPAGTAELGLGLLGAASRGRGVGTAACRVALRHAFEDLRLQRVHLRVMTDNPAVRLYERLGFRREGTLRRHLYKRGAHRDLHLYGLLREEWTP